MSNRIRIVQNAANDLPAALRTWVDHARVSQAGPQPFARRTGQTGAHRILQNVTQNRDQMFIALHRKTLESSLPDVSAGSVMVVITTHVACEQPLHELT